MKLAVKSKIQCLRRVQPIKHQRLIRNMSFLSRNNRIQKGFSFSQPLRLSLVSPVHFSAKSFISSSKSNFAFEGYDFDTDPEMMGGFDKNEIKAKKGVWKKAKKGGATTGKSIEDAIAETGSNKMTALEIAFKASTPRVKLPKRSPQKLAEEKKIANAYSQGLNLEKKNLLDATNLRIKLKLEAIAQLPIAFQEDAWRPDDTGYPEETWWPTWTVPETFPARFRLIEDPEEKKKSKTNATEKKMNMERLYGKPKSTTVVK